jgi:hypothetical protein
VISAARVVNFGTLPLGALLAGAAAEVVDIRFVLAVAAVGVAASAVWLIGAPAAPAPAAAGAGDE